MKPTPRRRRVLRAWPLWASAAAVGLGAWLSSPRFRGPPGANFDGRRFRNPRPTRHATAADLVKWQLSRQRGRWGAYRSEPFGPRPVRRVEGERLVVTYVNHATVLIQTGGLNVLTDPIWSERCSPVGFAGPRRVRPPGVRFEDLPRIDVVLVSHNHYDHLDLPTLRRLARAHRPAMVVPLGVAALLARARLPEVPTYELDWWESRNLEGGRGAVTAVPAQHFSGRGPWDRDTSLWAGFVLETAGGRVYFAGDTGAGPHFAEIRERLGPPRLALLPIGAFEPRWFMSGVHVSPEEALDAHVQLGAETSVGIHHGTFELADDGETEANERLERALERQAAPRPRFWVLGFGEGREVPGSGASTSGPLDERRKIPVRAGDEDPL